MPGDVRITIAGKTYPLVSDTGLPSGKRAIERVYRPTNGGDPSRIQRVTWKLGGPIGASWESRSGYLGVDYTQNIETRWQDRIFSLGKRTAVSLSASQPPVFGATTNSMFGTAYFGTSYFGGVQVITGTSSSSGDVVRHFEELQGYLLVFHGSIVNQLGPLITPSFSIVDTETLPSQPFDVERWDTLVWVCYGPSTWMSQIFQAAESGLTIVHGFGSTEDLYVTALAAGSDRLWFGKYLANKHTISYTFDQFNTRANPFAVGDPSEGVNGIGPFGPYTYVGKTNGLYSFNDQGKPVPLSKALEGHRSLYNGDQWADAGFGWNYAITDVGLRAISGSTDNPVGIGERMPQFTGHGGRVTAIWPERGELFVAYLTTAGNAYMYRCLFSDETAGTGQPDLYPFRYLTSTEVGAIFSTNTPTNTIVIWGENGNIAYETISRDGRDDTFAARLYSTSGGIWYGTTLDREPHLIKTLRLARLRALNVEFCSDWQLAMTYDVDPWIAETSRVYINVGQLMDKPGYYTLRPTAGPGGGTSEGPAPMENISGRTLRPRLTQRAEGPNAETLPPELNGTLEVEYDERPEMIWEVRCLVEAGDRPERRVNEIARLADNNTEGPVRISIPNDSSKYAMVAGVERKDIFGDGVEAIEVTLHIWDSE